MASFCFSAGKSSFAVPDYKKAKKISMNGFVAQEDGWLFFIVGPGGYCHLYIDGGYIYDAHMGSSEYDCEVLPVRKGSVVKLGSDSSSYYAAYFFPLSK